MSTSNKLLASVIFSTYNSEAWLEKVLWGFSKQSVQNFEIIVADDGSRETTKELIDRIKVSYPVTIQHVWQEDKGFQKSQILNKAILASKSDYLIFTDGDCIPRFDFVEQHLRFREEGYFLSGGYFKLPMSTSQQITQQDVESQNCFKLNWLRKNGLPFSFKNIKLIATGLLSKLLNALTPTKATWNGHNASGWKKDLMAINGFNQEMQYGGQDRELGERLVNYGLKSKQIRYNAICLHLDHARGYVNKETWEKNYNIREKTKKEKIIRTEYGIDLNQ
jgi:glycosyltransferase involved in cell wall biosynthesis